MKQGWVWPYRQILETAYKQKQGTSLIRCHYGLDVAAACKACDAEKEECCTKPDTITTAWSQPHHHPSLHASANLLGLSYMAHHSMLPHLLVMYRVPGHVIQHHAACSHKIDANTAGQRRNQKHLQKQLQNRVSFYVSSNQRWALQSPDVLQHHARWHNQVDAYTAS